MPEPTFRRVRVKSTKAHITINATAFDESLHAPLKQDALDRNGKPRGPKYPSTSASPGDAEGEAAPTATTTSEATKEAKP